MVGVNRRQNPRRHGELDPARQEKIRRAAQLSSEYHGIEVIPLVIDARRKESASKTKASDSLRERLHRSASGTDSGEQDDQAA